MYNPVVSVILPTYNRWQIIEQSVKSILEQSYSNLELIIVNDGSTDKTSVLLEKIKLADSRITVINNPCNIGLPSSRNLGVSKARGSLIFFSEDDLILSQDCLSILVKSLTNLLKANPSVGAVGPRLIACPKRENTALKTVVCINPITRDIKCNFELDTYKITKVELLHSCSLIRRSAILEVGGYENKLYKGSYSREESDFYLRVRGKGYTLFFEPKAVAYHYSGGLGGCILKSKTWGEYYNLRNQLLYSVRFYGLSTIIAFPAFMLDYLNVKLRNHR